MVITEEYFCVIFELVSLRSFYVDLQRIYQLSSGKLISKGITIKGINITKRCYR